MSADEMSIGASDVVKRLEVAAPGSDAAKIARALLGCQWGQVVGEPGQEGLRCVEQAVRITVLHDGDREVPVKLCAAHTKRVVELSTPHEEAT